MKSVIGDRKVTKVVIAGVLDQWTPAFFDKPFISDTGDFNYGEDLGVGDTSSAVLNALDAIGVPVEQRSEAGNFNINP